MGECDSLIFIKKSDDIEEKVGKSLSVLNLYKMGRRYSNLLEAAKASGKY